MILLFLFLFLGSTCIGIQQYAYKKLDLSSLNDPTEPRDER